MGLAPFLTFRFTSNRAEWVFGMAFCSNKQKMHHKKNENQRPRRFVGGNRRQKKGRVILKTREKNKQGQ